MATTSKSSTFLPSACTSDEPSSAVGSSVLPDPDMLQPAGSRSPDTPAKQNAPPSATACKCDTLPSATLHEVSVAEKMDVPNCTEGPYLKTKVPYPKAIQYALAVAFIVASFLSAVCAMTCISGFIWRTSNAVFARLAHISDATSEEIERSRREARIMVVSDIVKIATTRRYVHGMRYWQEMAMTVVQLDDLTIFYNPVPMPLEDMRTLACGKQVLVVVPNMYHHMFVDDYITAFPSATLVGSQCAAERHTPCLAVSLPSMVSLPADVELLRVDGWALDEYIMVVHSERLFSAAHFISCGTELSVGGATLLPACLKSAVCKATRWHPAGCLPLYERLTVSDKVAAASFVARLRSLDLQTSVSAHGGICNDDARQVLQRAWGWTEHVKCTSGQPCVTDATPSNACKMVE